jgi:ketosteroid isomerase-like protein
MQTYLGELAGSWGMGELVFYDYIYDPESKIMAVTGVEKNGKALPTGRSCNMDFIWEFRFTDAGKIRYVREYNDTFAIGGTFDG